MKKLFTFAAIVVALALLVTAMVVAQDKPKATFVSEKGCKGCHAAEFKAWSETKHANAFAALKPEEQKKAECIGCHQTGAMADGTTIVNVTCEACHGAGSEYKKTMMKKADWTADKAAALKKAEAAGLVLPTAETCTSSCHKKEGNPNFKPFDFEKAKLLVHPVKAAEPAPKG